VLEKGTETLVGVLPLLWEEGDYLLSCCVRVVLRTSGGLMLCDWAHGHSANDCGLCKMLWVWEREEETRERNNNVGRYRRGDVVGNDTPNTEEL